VDRLLVTFATLTSMGRDDRRWGAVRYL